MRYAQARLRLGDSAATRGAMGGEQAFGNVDVRVSTLGVRYAQDRPHLVAQYMVSKLLGDGECTGSS